MHHEKKLLFLIIQFVCGSIFPSTYPYHVSSAWYPSKGKQLTRKIDQVAQAARQKFASHLDLKKIKAVIVPHAGYDYSGVVASSVYQNLKPESFERIIILGPSHHVDFEGVGLFDPVYGWYKSPLISPIQIDLKFIQKLRKSSSLFTTQRQAHALEHSIEVQIPFIQTYCPTCKIVPLLVGSVSDDQVRTIADCLGKLLDEKTLLVISSDFTHYGASFGYEPFTQNILQNIFKLDGSLVQKIANFDLQGFKSVLEKTKATVCGKNPIMILLSMLEQKYFGEVDSYLIGYDTSAQDEKNPAHCVSYVSMVFSQQKKNQLSLQDRLTGYEKNFLLKLAQTRLQQVVDNQDDTKTVDDNLPGILTELLCDHAGAFVTLHTGSKLYKEQQLRGCIGSWESDKPLYQVVWDMTKSAALFDSRFTPVKPAELPNISISISVLTKPEYILSYKDIVLGTDGIILHQGAAQAVYLPQVAVEQKWNLEQTLESLSQKAGLASDAWKDVKTKFEVFQSIDIV